MAIEMTGARRIQQFPFKLIVVPNPTSRYNYQAIVGANMIQAQLEAKPESSFLWATGGSLKPAYAEIVRRQQAGLLDFSMTRAHGNLDRYRWEDTLPDEWRHIGYKPYLHQRVYGLLGIPLERIIMLDANASDAAIACAKYEAEIRAIGGFDFGVLGLGPKPSSHVGFMLPGPKSTIDSRTMEVDLDERTIWANARDVMDAHDRAVLGLEEDQDPWPVRDRWNDEQRKHFESVVMPRLPKQALSMGIGTILEVGKLRMFVNSPTKADALEMMLTSEPSTDVPAAWTKCSKDFEVVADQAAAARLPWPYNQVGEYTITETLKPRSK